MCSVATATCATDLGWWGQGTPWSWPHVWGGAVPTPGQEQGAQWAASKHPPGRTSICPEEVRGKNITPKPTYLGAQRNDEAQVNSTPTFYPCTSFRVTASTCARQPNDFKHSTMGSVLMKTLRTPCPTEDKLLKAVIVHGQVLSVWFSQSNTR